MSPSNAQSAIMKTRISTGASMVNSDVNYGVFGISRPLKSTSENTPALQDTVNFLKKTYRRGVTDLTHRRRNF